MVSIQLAESFFLGGGYERSPIITILSCAPMVNTCKSKAIKRLLACLIIVTLQLSQLEGLRKSWRRYIGWCSLSAVKTVCCPPKNNRDEDRAKEQELNLCNSVIHFL